MWKNKKTDHKNIKSRKGFSLTQLNWSPDCSELSFIVVIQTVGTIHALRVQSLQKPLCMLTRCTSSWDGGMMDYKSVPQLEPITVADGQPARCEASSALCDPSRGFAYADE